MTTLTKEEVENSLKRADNMYYMLSDIKTIIEECKELL